MSSRMFRQTRPSCIFIPCARSTRQANNAPQSTLSTSHPWRSTAVAGDDIDSSASDYSRSVSLVQPKTMLNGVMAHRQSPRYLVMGHETCTPSLLSIPIASRVRLTACYTVMPKLTEYEPHPGKAPTLPVRGYPGRNSFVLPHLPVFFIRLPSAINVVGQGVPLRQLYCVQFQQPCPLT